MPVLALVLASCALAPSKDRGPTTTSSSPSAAPPTSYDPSTTTCVEGCCHFTCPEHWISDITPTGAAVAPDVSVVATIAGGPFLSLNQWMNEGSLTIDGVSGDYSVSDDGLVMTFAPDAPLAPATTWHATADVTLVIGDSMCYVPCPDEVSVDFTTLPATDPALVIGKTFALPGSALALAAPADPSLLAPLPDLLFEVESVDSTGAAVVAVAAAQGEGTGPDCATALVEGADLSANPVLRLTGQLGAFEAASLRGVLDPTGGVLGDVTLAASLPTEAVPGGLDCASFAANSPGASCAPCESSPSGQCLVVDAAAAAAVADPSLDLAGTCGL